MATKNEIVKLKTDVIEDIFFYKNQKIAILNNKLFKKVSEDRLIFVQLVLDDDGNELIQPIEEEEYENIFKTYKTILKAINGEVK